MKSPLLCQLSYAPQGAGLSTLPREFRQGGTRCGPKARALPARRDSRRSGRPVSHPRGPPVEHCASAHSARWPATARLGQKARAPAGSRRAPSQYVFPRWLGVELAPGLAELLLLLRPQLSPALVQEALCLLDRRAAARAVHGLLERSGLAPLVQAVLSIEDAKHWKPQAAAYQHAEQKLGFRADQLALVAAHAWDVQGAKRAGWRAAWVSRLEKQFHPAMQAGDVTGSTVEEAVRALLDGR
ncbi:MAG: hypothetical protein E6J64_02195 [Deltaproteobacteria bacterium]|nr:MAG: hypothetical protein E6J64_02195 [Deltaproteobacteria bacterium]